MSDGQSTDEALERLRRLFKFFADTQCRGRSPVYETLSQGVADSDALLDMLMRTPGDQRRPSLLFAAVNLILAAHPAAALASYYPVHGGQRPVDEHLVAAFTAFCAEQMTSSGGCCARSPPRPTRSADARLSASGQGPLAAATAVPDRSQPASPRPP